MAETFGQMLRRFRVARQFTQAELAERTGVTEQAIQLLETGARRFPRKSTTDRLTIALGLSSADAAELVAAVPRRGPATATASEQRPPGASGGPWRVAREVPEVDPHFTGRAPELELLCRALLTPAGPGSARVVTIQGMAGVGKSALAAAAAAQVATEFPDGLLAVDLNGFGSGRPLTPWEALQQLLRGTGLADPEIPADQAEAASLLRTRLAGRRTLMVLENATGPDQVADLLPATADSAAIVISRVWLTRLVAASHVQVDVLTDEVALDVLRSVAGPSRVAAEPDASARLIRSCAGLPLALRIAAGRLAAQPHRLVQHVADRLEDEQRRLGELSTDDLSVRSSLEVSFGESDASTPSQKMLAVLGLLDSTEVGTAAAARLAGSSESIASQELESLVDAHVLGSVAPDRYQAHDLVHLYARELAARLVAPDEQQQALARLLDLYEAAAWTAGKLIEPLSPRLAWAPTDLPEGPRLTTSGQAIEWIQEEHNILLRLATKVGDGPLADRLARLTVALTTYFIACGRFLDHAALATLALEHSTDRTLAAAVRGDLGIAQAQLGQPGPALASFEHAAAEFHAVGHRTGEAVALNNAARMLADQRHFDDAINRAERALRLTRAISDPLGTNLSLTVLGVSHCLRGELERGREYFVEGLAGCVESGNETGRALALHNIGSADLELNRIEDAIDYLEQAVALTRTGGMQSSLGNLLIDIAEAYLRQGDHDRARAAAREALDIATAAEDQLRQDRAHARLRQIDEHHTAT
ncbi:hypothetical protein GCM10028799_35030 [Kribbella italica]